MRDRQAAQQQERATAQTTAEHAETQLAQAEEARRTLATLAPRVEQQTLLEQQMSEAQQQSKRLREVEQEQPLLEADCARRAEEVRSQAQRIAAIEAQRTEAALLAERRAEVERLSPGSAAPR